MSRCTNDEVMYFKEILADHLQSNYPLVVMSEKEMLKRSQSAALLYYRDDLTCTEVIEQQFATLLCGYSNEHDSAIGITIDCMSAN